MPYAGDGQPLARLPLYLSAREYLALTDEVRAQFTCIVQGTIIDIAKEEDQE